MNPYGLVDGATAHSHHRWVVAQEFAFDLLRTGADGLTHRGSGDRRRRVITSSTARIRG